METKNHKRWQNLIFGKCPKCDARLNVRKDKVPIFECPTEGCGFMITDKSLANILMDENHIMRKFLTAHEKQILNDAINYVIKPKV
jgi:ribosomal protein L37AE/L43A